MIPHALLQFCRIIVKLILGTIRVQSSQVIHNALYRKIITVYIMHGKRRIKQYWRENHMHCIIHMLVQKCSFQLQFPLFPIWLECIVLRHNQKYYQNVASLPIASCLSVNCKHNDCNCCWDGIQHMTHHCSHVNWAHCYEKLLLVYIT